jgi:hypothetical protein
MGSHVEHGGVFSSLEVPVEDALPHHLSHGCRILVRWVVD